MKQLNWSFYIAGQAGVIPLAIGSPGMAKTASVKSLAQATGRTFHAYMLDQSLPEDLGGYKVVRNVDGLDMMMSIHDERLIRARLEPSILLVDELTNCGHSTQAAALQLMNEGINGCWVFAAANPIDKAAAGVDLTPPMVNRLCILEWELDTDAVLTGWKHGFNFPAPEIPILPADWQSYCTKWGHLLSMFIERKPDLLSAFPVDLAKASEPYPTPRSWTNAGRLLAAAESVNANEFVKSALVSGCVGEGARNEFFSWLEQAGLPDPEWLLQYPEKLVMPGRGDLAIATLNCVLGAVRSNNTPDRWEACCTVIEYAYGFNPEVTMSAMGSVMKMKPAGHMPVARNGRWAEIQKEFLATAK